MAGCARYRHFLFAPALLALQLSTGFHANAASPDDRQRALALFAEGRRLEALPLLERIERNEPRDSEVLVALAASLVEHAATLSDPGAMANERLRAKELLQRAFDLGNTSPLQENLRQLLGELPADGVIRFSADPAVQRAMNAGEAAFARHEFAAALQQYTLALKLEPGNYYAALFTANTLDRQGDAHKAAAWYERAAALNPDAEAAFRYYADMLAKHGDMLKARSMLIRAAVAEPYNKIVWREIRAWAIINHTAFNIVYLPIPQPPKIAASTTGPAAGIAAAWQAYYSVKVRWRNGVSFHERYPREPIYRHSLAEESDALSAAAKTLHRLAAQDKGAQAVNSDPIAPLLLRVYEAGLIDAYVLFSLGDDGIAQDYTAYRATHRAQLESYLDRFVMPQARPSAPTERDSVRD
jgi:tetratricopeptide (TPR) repeat protein